MIEEMEGLPKSSVTMVLAPPDAGHLLHRLSRVLAVARTNCKGSLARLLYAMRNVAIAYEDSATADGLVVCFARLQPHSAVYISVCDYICSFQCKVTPDTDP